MQESMLYNQRTIEFQVVYRKRKTLEIQVIPPGKVRVVAPCGVSKRFIRQCLESKASWILKKLTEIEAKEDLIPKRRYSEGEIFLFLDDELVLKTIKNEFLQKPRVWKAETENVGPNELLVETPVMEETIIKAGIEEWYKEQAMKVFKDRINYYGEMVGRRPERIRLSNAQKRWGSCTAQKTILFNWRIIMAPLRVLDYLVVHELCHLVHLNHSAGFWRLVSEILPGFQGERDWLKKNGYRLVL